MGVQFSTIYINLCKYQLIQYCGKAYREGIESIYLYILYIFRGAFISFVQFQFIIRIYIIYIFRELRSYRLVFVLSSRVISCTLVVLYIYFSIIVRIRKHTYYYTYYIEKIFIILKTVLVLSALNRFTAVVKLPC